MVGLILLAIIVLCIIFKLEEINFEAQKRIKNVEKTEAEWIEIKTGHSKCSHCGKNLYYCVGNIYDLSNYCGECGFKIIGIKTDEHKT